MGVGQTCGSNFTSNHGLPLLSQLPVQKLICAHATDHREQCLSFNRTLHLCRAPRAFAAGAIGFGWNWPRRVRSVAAHVGKLLQGDSLSAHRPVPPCVERSPRAPLPGDVGGALALHPAGPPARPANACGQVGARNELSRCVRVPTISRPREPPSTTARTRSSSYTWTQSSTASSAMARSG